MSSLFTNSNRHFAFSLIEVVLIIALVAITFVGVMSLTRRILEMEYLIKNDFIAQGLLREGAEIAEAMTKQNVSSSIALYSGFYSSDIELLNATTSALGQVGKPVIVDWLSISPASRATTTTWLATAGTAITTSDTARLKLATTSTNPGINQYYQIATGTPTNFYRIISPIVRRAGILAPTKFALDLSITVYWEDHGKGHFSNLQTSLYEKQY